MEVEKSPVPCVGALNCDDPQVSSSAMEGQFHFERYAGVGAREGPRWTPPAHPAYNKMG
jgi:hypothetical protein